MTLKDGEDCVSWRGSLQLFACENIMEKIIATGHYGSNSGASE